MKNENVYMKKSEEREFGYEFARRFLAMQELIENIKLERLPEGKILTSEELEKLKYTFGILEKVD